MKPVTDPNILAQLNAPSSIGEAFGHPVTDPNVLAALSGAPRDEDMGIAPVEGPFMNKLRDLAIIGQRGLAGYGRGVASLGEGLKQAGMHAGGAMGLIDPKDVSDYDRQIAEEAQLYNRDLGQTGAGQVGNFLGQAVTTLPLGGPAAKGAGIFASAGRTALQGATVGALQPVEEVRQPQSLSDLVEGTPAQGEDYGRAKLGQAALGAAIGGGSNLALRGLGAVAEAAQNLPTLRFRAKAGTPVVEAVNAPAPTAEVQPAAITNPSDFAEAQTQAADQAAKASNTPANAARDFIAESDQLSKETGVPLTPGQSTGSKGLMQMEQTARQSGKTADQVFAQDKAATQALDDYITRVTNNVSKNAATPEETGDLVRTALNKKVASLDAARRAQASTDYGAVRDLTNGAANIEPQNANAELQKIVSDYEGVGSPGADSLVRFAKKQLANIDPNAKAAVDNPSGLVDARGNLLTSPADAAASASATAPAQGNLDKLIQLRSYLSKVAGGQAKISGDNVDRKLAAQLLGAIDNDMLSAQGVGGKVGDALKTANANYRNASQQIDYVKQSPLGKLLGQEVTNGGDTFNTIPPEKLISRLKTMQTSQVSTTRALMQDSAPDAWQQAKRTIIENALEQARTTPVSKGANPLAIQPGEFVRAIYGGSTPKAIANGQAWAKAMFDPGELADIQKAVGVAKRLGDMTGYNASGTAPMLEQGLTDIATKAAMGSKIGMAQKAVGLANDFFASKRLAAAMADPNGRKALLQLQKLPPESAKARELTSYLATLAPAVSVPSDSQQPGKEQ